MVVAAVSTGSLKRQRYGGGNERGEGMEDEEDFVFFGTPIEREEDTSARKRKAIADAGQLRSLPPWKQEVRDEEGRRRLHCAFTGGFLLATIILLVQKRWTPQMFSSSRKSRAEVKQHSIYNFLDDDDLKDMGGHALETSMQFDTFGFTAAEVTRKQAEKDQHKRLCFPIWIDFLLLTGLAIIACGESSL